MLKKSVFVFIFALLLTACGQDANLNHKDAPNNDTNVAAETNTPSTEAKGVSSATDDQGNAENSTPDNEPEEENDFQDDTSDPDKDTSGSLSDLKVHYIDVG